MKSKAALEKLSDEQELKLTKELNRLSEKGSRIITNSLFIIGGMALTYSIFKIVIDDESPKKAKKVIKASKEAASKKSKSAFSEITQTFTEGAVLFLLGLAKEKLVEYLNKNDEPSK